MDQRITNFHLDHESHWVADLECGHGQHMRHDPPWMERPWVLTEEGRSGRIGTALNCVRCDEAAKAMGEAVLEEIRKLMKEAVEQGGLSGLCAEGRIDLALDSLNTIDLQSIAKKALGSL